MTVAELQNTLPHSKDNHKLTENARPSNSNRSRDNWRSPSVIILSVMGDFLSHSIFKTLSARMIQTQTSKTDLQTISKPQNICIDRHLFHTLELLDPRQENVIVQSTEEGQVKLLQAPILSKHLKESLHLSFSPRTPIHTHREVSQVRVLFEKRLCPERVIAVLFVYNELKYFNCGSRRSILYQLD
jgi:hypothetical protein